MGVICIHYEGMELEHALKLLKLTPDCNLQKLNESFRKLAKIYHPDSNRGREEWAHRNMTELNLAYETLLDFITTPRGGLGDERTSKERSAKSTYQTLFNRGINRVLDGLYTYYQYGLENVHLRYEGVRRLRFRDSLRNLQDGVHSLEQLKTLPKSEGAAGRLQLFTDFAKAFFQSMLIENYAAPPGMSAELTAYRHFRDGSSHLDYAIKDALFGDQLISVRTGTYAEKLKLSREELMIVLSRYYNSSCVSEAMVKMYLLEVFSKVVQLMHRMRH
jgi:hypothetical protein